MMSQLPEHVSDQEIEEMFQFADRDDDGQISWEEFLLMITPVKLVEADKPRLVRPPVRLEETNSEADTKKKVSLHCKSVENLRAPEKSEMEKELLENKEDRSGDNLEMVLRPQTEHNEAVNHHQNMPDSTAETRADETVVYEVGTGTKEGSSQAG